MSNRYTAVFDAYHLYHLPMFEPVIDHLRHDADFQVVLTTSAATQPAEQRLATDALEKFGRETVISSTESERKKAIRALNPDAFICGWSRCPIDEFVTSKTLCAMLYHGIGVKPTYRRDNHPRLDLRFVEGPSRYRQLAAHGVMTEFCQVGFAKLDPLDGKVAQRVRDALLERLNGKSSGVGRASPRLP